MPTSCELPDPDDRLTSNTKDFPDSALQSHSVLAMGTDQFLTLESFFQPLKVEAIHGEPLMNHEQTWWPRCLTH